jgi:hypothetical protein
VTRKNFKDFPLTEEQCRLLDELYTLPEKSSGAALIAPKVVESVQLSGRGAGLEPEMQWIDLRPQYEYVWQHISGDGTQPHSHKEEA